MAFITVSHWRNADIDEWKRRWPNFHPSEFASSDDKSLKINIAFLDALQRIRTRFGKPMHVTSGYRSPAHNKRVGGVKNSQHVKGRAADIAIASVADGRKLERLAREEGMTGIGRYPNRKFIHMDMRTGTPATWGKW